MAYQATYYAKVFVFKQNGVPINISGWTFRAQFRAQVTDTAVLLELTTANTGFAITDAVNGKVEMRITSAQLNAMPVAVAVFDVMRTDASPGPLRLFGGKLKVKQPVTR